MLDLYHANTLAAFWRLLLDAPVSSAEWAETVRATASILPPMDTPIGGNSDDVVPLVLSEAHMSPNRWRLGWDRQLYYEVKPLLPRQLNIALRQRYRWIQERRFPLAWPIEDRYARFLYGCAAHLLRRRGLDLAPFVGFWPDGHRFAFVLTHDVERGPGQAFVRSVADIEECLGYRSVFNFVPERYPIDHGLLADLRQRGFEIGVHGLKHDGTLFSSKQAFERQARRINQYLREWDAVGFRAPYMHRNPRWQQALRVEYDLSFFDTDPYEPMPGGTMSMWPFFLGHFVELPYTLAQDHTLMAVLGERTPRLWLDKVDVLERWQGMALLNTHPDYLLEPGRLALYRAFLEAMKERGNYWHALPRDVARWWRRRADYRALRHDGRGGLLGLPGGRVSHLRVVDAGV